MVRLLGWGALAPFGVTLTMLPADERAHLISVLEGLEPGPARG